MEITINDKQPEVKPLNELNTGEVFKITDHYFIKTSMGPYDNYKEILCIDLKTGESKQINPTEPVTPVEAELNISL